MQLEASEHWYSVALETFGLTNIPEAPKGWQSALPLQEKPLETLLALHFPALCGSPVGMQVVGRSGDYWGAMDLDALDALGRLHLVELKKGVVKASAAAQLQQYLAELVLFDPDEHIRSRWHRLVEWECHPGRLATFLAGIVAGRDDATSGHKDAAAYAGYPGTEYAWKTSLAEALDWKGDDEGSRNLWRIRTLLAIAKEAGIAPPTVQELRECAASLAADRWTNRPLPQRRCVANPGYVLWLVGSRLSTADDSLMAWRRQGIDARFLEFEGRLVADARAVILRVRREARSMLDQLEANAIMKIQAFGFGVDAPRPRLSFKFYDAGRPSSGGGTGSVLADPRIELEYARVEAIKIGVSG